MLQSYHQFNHLLVCYAALTIVNTRLSYSLQTGRTNEGIAVLEKISFDALPRLISFLFVN